MKEFAWDTSNIDADGIFSWIPDHDAARVKFTDTYATEGIIRWASNDSVPPEDCVAHWHFLGLVSDRTVQLCNRRRQAESEAAIRKYREAQAKHPPSAEEMFEMRAAFGVGEVVVNVLTGRRTQL